MHLAPRLLSFVVVLATPLWMFCGPGYGETFYSVDTVTNELVRVDATTGVVTPVGSTGSTLVAPNLAAVGRTIYATSVATGGWDLFHVDACTGAVTDSVRIDLPGQTLTTAEGLAAPLGQLVLAFRTNQGSVFNSNMLGDLDPNGTVSSSVQFDPDTDMDGLGASSLGVLYGTDTRPPVDSVYVFAAPGPPGEPAIGGYSSPGGLSDLEFTGADELYGLDDAQQLLIEISLVNGLPLTQIPLVSSGPLRGLARVTLPDSDGDGVPDECELVGAGEGLETSSWGRVKAQYRSP